MVHGSEVCLGGEACADPARRGASQVQLQKTTEETAEETPEKEAQFAYQCIQFFETEEKCETHSDGRCFWDGERCQWKAEEMTDLCPVFPTEEICTVRASCFWHDET